MYAIVRQYEYEPTKLASAAPTLTEVAELHASQPGYAGSLLIDDGSRLIAVNLWDSEQAAAAGRATIGPRVQRLLEPLAAAPTRLIAAGEVRANDFHRAD
jgi:hypothetical protein